MERTGDEFKVDIWQLTVDNIPNWNLEQNKLTGFFPTSNSLYFLFSTPISQHKIQEHNAQMITWNAKCKAPPKNNNALILYFMRL